MKINNIIKPDTSIKDCASLLNENGKKICFVTSDDGVLIGVITDSEIRRAILNDVHMDSGVKVIMKQNPLCRTPEDDREYIRLEVDRLGIQAMPIIDKDNRIIDVVYGSFVEQTAVDNTTVLIQAGGFGTRLVELTKETPKPMLEIDGKPMLERLIISLKQQGFSDFIISTHYLAEKIISYFADGSEFGVKIQYTNEETPLGTAGSLSLLKDNVEIRDNLIIVNGDVLTNIDFRRLVNFHMDSKADASICIKEYEFAVPYGVCAVQGDELEKIEEKPSFKFLVNTGVYVLRSKLVHRLKPNHPLDMPALISSLKNDGYLLKVYPIYEYWLDIGQPDDFKRAQIDVNRI